MGASETIAFRSERWSIVDFKRRFVNEFVTKVNSSHTRA